MNKDIYRIPGNDGFMCQPVPAKEILEEAGILDIITTPQNDIDITEGTTDWDTAGIDVQAGFEVDLTPFYSIVLSGPGRTYDRFVAKEQADKRFKLDTVSRDVDDEAGPVLDYIQSDVLRKLTGQSIALGPIVENPTTRF